jgi:hypothetical protein
VTYPHLHVAFATSLEDVLDATSRLRRFGDAEGPITNWTEWRTSYPMGSAECSH